MVRRRSCEERGLAGIILVAVLVWVVLAVALLGQTLWDTQTIHHDVAQIDGRLAGINANTSAVGLAAQTGDVAKNILASVQPLSGQLDQVLATPIPDEAAAIAAKAGDIETTAASIGRSVQDIHGTVESIQATAASIAAKATDIEQTAAGIGAHVGSIHDRAAAIDSGVAAILDAARAIRGSYDGPSNGSGVAGINHHVDEIIALAQGIHGDLAAVFGIVNPAGGPGPGANLYGHVKSIDDQSLVTILGQLHLPSKR
jgi:methyl-accepting chemotaxis protein